MILKYSEFLNEGKNIADLYHFTTIQALVDILLSDTLHGPTSLTRNKNFYKETKIIPKEVCIQLNGSKLSNNYKLVPYSYLHDPFVKSMTKGKMTSFENQYEEQTTKDIKNLSRYVRQILVKEIDLWDYMDATEAFAEQAHRDIANHLGIAPDEVSFNSMVQFFEWFENVKVVDNFDETLAIV